MEELNLNYEESDCQQESLKKIENKLKEEEKLKIDNNNYNESLKKKNSKLKNNNIVVNNMSTSEKFIKKIKIEKKEKDNAVKYLTEKYPNIKKEIKEKQLTIEDFDRNKIKKKRAILAKMLFKKK